MLTLYDVCKTTLGQMGFWGDFWRVSREETPFMGFCATVSRCCAMTRSADNTCCFALFYCLGCFQKSLSVHFLLFWCCFDELSLWNHVYLRLMSMWESKTRYKRDDIICCRCERAKQNIKEMTLSTADVREQEKI